MVGGPDVSVKIASVDKDASFNIYESWSYLLKNYLTIILVAATVWLLVVGVRFSITIGSDLLFGSFKELHENKASEQKANQTTISIDDLIIAGVNLGVDENNKEAANEISADKYEELTNSTYIIFIVLIMSGVIRGLLLHIPSWRTSGGDGMAQSLEYYHETYDYEEGNPDFPRYKKSTFIQAFRRSVLTSLTVGCGGSGGIEAPVVPMGECIGAGWSRVLKIAKPDDLRIFQMAGISAAVTTLLDAPLTSALFAAEIVYNARILYRPLMYSLIGSIVAFALNNHFGFFEPLFKPRALSHIYSLREYLEVSVVALLCSAPASIGITVLFKKLNQLIKPFPELLKPVIGAIGTGIVGLSIWYGLGLEPQHVLGVSEDTIIQVMAGEGNPLLKVWWVLVVLVVAKAFATGFTLMAGGSAGRLVPAMYLGGISGAAIYYLLAALGYTTDADTAVFVVAGLASALVAVVQVPLAAIALVMEVFGTNYGPPAIVSCVLTYLLARRWQLYAK
jgi:CIC family chloride channel protein